MLHSSYSFALAFEPSLVGSALKNLGADDNSVVLDPFCGTGTALLESKINSVPSIGVDANPVCIIVSRAKTNWRLDSEMTRSTAEHVLRDARRSYECYLRRYVRAKSRNRYHRATADELFVKTVAGKYLLESGLMARGWIGARPALKTLLLAERIWRLPQSEKNFLLLCLLGVLVPKISNMSYGPEIYRKRRRVDCDVFGIFGDSVSGNLQKLDHLRRTCAGAPCRIQRGDSVNAGLSFIKTGSVDFVITSPPYLSDHDYSRLTRLELNLFRRGWFDSRPSFRKANAAAFVF